MLRGGFSMSDRHVFQNGREIHSHNSPSGEAFIGTIQETFLFIVRFGLLTCNQECERHSIWSRIILPSFTRDNSSS
jgi:hypothetical protein